MYSVYTQHTIMAKLNQNFRNVSKCIKKEKLKSHMYSDSAMTLKNVVQMHPVSLDQLA